MPQQFPVGTAHDVHYFWASDMSPQAVGRVDLFHGCDERLIRGLGESSSKLRVFGVPLLTCSDGLIACGASCSRSAEG